MMYSAYRAADCAKIRSAKRMSPRAATRTSGASPAAAGGPPQICKFFAQSGAEGCLKAEFCPFSHDAGTLAASPLCRYHQQVSFRRDEARFELPLTRLHRPMQGACKFGTRCNFLHGSDCETCGVRGVVHPYNPKGEGKGKRSGREANLAAPLLSLAFLCFGNVANACERASKASRRLGEKRDLESKRAHRLSFARSLSLLSIVITSHRRS
jgi:hypothetical protein